MRSRKVLLFALHIMTLLVISQGSCWQPSRIVQSLCAKAANNSFPTLQMLQQQYYSGSRRLLWQDGGPASLDIPNHILSERARFRGDGGTIQTYKGQSIPQPGSPDWDLLYATQIQTRFMRFNEGQAAQGHTLIYGYEDVWFENLLKCTSNPDEQVCDYCATHCDDSTWQSSGYSLLNGTELVIENLIWMTHNVYISQSTILPYSFCTEYDWWICARRLPTNVIVLLSGYGQLTIFFTVR